VHRRQFLAAAAPATLLAATAGTAEASHSRASVGAEAQDALNALFRWSLGYDERDVDLMRTAFTHDARFVLHPPDGADPLVFTGIDAVMKLFTDSLAAQTDLRRHVTTNPLVERLGHRILRVTSNLTLIVIDEGVLRVQSTGIYRDVVVRGPDGTWRIRERDLTLDLPS
jgi:hypothetical protein